MYLMLKEEIKNNETHMDFIEFLELITSRVSRKDTRRDMKKIFSMLDEDKTGLISVTTLKKVPSDLGDNIDES